jgi:hypothetical protein
MLFFSQLKRLIVSNFSNVLGEIKLEGLRESIKLLFRFLKNSSKRNRNQESLLTIKVNAKLGINSASLELFVEDLRGTAQQE